MTSKDPNYKNYKHKRVEPPEGSVAVFEWEPLSKLKDFSDESMAEVFKHISRDIIERPYHYDPHQLITQKGVFLPPNQVEAMYKEPDNNSPPEKIPGIGVFKKNHGTGHALRQMKYTEALIDKTAAEGNENAQKIAQSVNDNPEIKSIMKLAAYCKRIGRTNDSEHDNSPNRPTIYSKRSADMFAMMAEELGYQDDLIKVISESMIEYPVDANGKHQHNPSTFPKNEQIAGINSNELMRFSENILMAAHMTDLVRIFPVKSDFVKSALKDYFPPQQLSKVTTQLIEMGCQANMMTGSKVRKQEPGIRHTEYEGDGPTLVKVVKDIDNTINNLKGLTLINPSVSLKASQGPLLNSTIPISSTQNVQQGPAALLPLQNKLQSTYPYGKSGTRIHFCTVEGKGLEKPYIDKITAKPLRGDALKRAILDDFKKDLEKCTSEKELESCYTKFKGTPEYTVLETHQRPQTFKFEKSKTASIQALEKMCSDAKHILNPNLKQEMKNENENENQSTMSSKP